MTRSSNKSNAVKKLSKQSVSVRRSLRHKLSWLRLVSHFLARLRHYLALPPLKVYRLGRISTVRTFVSIGKLLQ